MFNGSGMVHKGRHGITDGWMRGITRLSCYGEVGKPKAGNCNFLEGLLIFNITAQAFGM